MRNYIGIFIVGFFVFTGCSSSNLGDGASSIEDRALEVNNLKGAPSWVLNGGSGGFSAIGSAQVTKAGLQFARTEAIALARDEVARIISTKVDGLVSSSIEQTIGDSAYNTNINKFSEQITRQIVSQVISGTKQKDTWITPDGKEIYVLVELDNILVQQAKEKIMQNISKDSIPLQKDKFMSNLDEALNSIF